MKRARSKSVTELSQLAQPMDVFGAFIVLLIPQVLERHQQRFLGAIFQIPKKSRTKALFVQLGMFQS